MPYLSAFSNVLLRCHLELVHMDWKDKQDIHECTRWIELVMHYVHVSQGFLTQKRVLPI